MRRKVKKIAAGILSVLLIVSFIVQPVVGSAAESEVSALEAVQYWEEENTADMAAEDESGDDKLPGKKIAPEEETSERTVTEEEMKYDTEEEERVPDEQAESVKSAQIESEADEQMDIDAGINTLTTDKEPGEDNPVLEEKAEEENAEDGIMLLADEQSLIVKNSKNESGMWNIPVMDYIYCSETGNQVHNYVKYIANDEVNGWRLAYCLQISRHFIDSTQYIGKQWEANGMYAEISYAIANGCRKYGDLNNAAYSTGNWIKDYYVTQSVIYCILKDYGYDGHSFGSLSAVSGYEDVFACIDAMYQDVKKNGNKAGDGYGDNPYYTITAPSSVSMEWNRDTSCYQTGWYTVKTGGDLVSANLTLVGAPEGTEIIYKNDSRSEFYIRIPEEKAYMIGDRTVNFKVRAEAKFARPAAWTYETLIADAQNITFLEQYVTDAPKISEAAVSLKLNMGRVKVIKVDSKTEDAGISGAVFGIYKDKDCTQLIREMPETDENGMSSVEFIRTQETVYLKEITAPEGYQLNHTVYSLDLSADESVSVTVADEEQMGELTIYKEGQVLTGAEVTETGIVFQYENHRQEGAVYEVYAGEDIHTAWGALIYRKGELVKGNLTTDVNGAAILQNLPLGIYVVREIQAPENYYNALEEKTVTLSYAGQTAEAAFAETTFVNERQRANVIVTKLDMDTKNPLSGGIYGLYTGSDITAWDGTVLVKKGTLIEKAVTGKDGTACFNADLPIGFGYEVKEEQAPQGYLRNSSDVYSFRFLYTGDQEAAVSFSHIFTNESVNATISLQKNDKETNSSYPQGDASLEKAVYGLYARTDILHPDGISGVLYEAGERVASMTTDRNGRASIENLYPGSYYVKEITPPVGYLADENEYDLTCNYEGDLTATVEKSLISCDQVIKQPFQIIKAADNGKTNADLLAGAGFSAYLVSSLKLREDGSYDFDASAPEIIGENGATEIFTDENGYACSIALPYGTYVVRETTVPHNYTPVEDFIVRITEHNPDTPQVWRVLLDEEFEAKLKIIKQDDETKKTVLAKNTEFKVYDLDHKKYVEQVTTYPKVTVHKSYFTDEEGYLILPQNLKTGHYRIEEVQAPVGYTLNKNYYEVTVDSNNAYRQDDISKDIIIETVYENHPVKGELKIVKQGEVLHGFEQDFIYEKENLEGAVFQVYAAEDIYTADYQKDDNGERTLVYAADTLVAEITTDEQGEAKLENLPLGVYKLVETKAPEGYVADESVQTVTFAYADQDTSVIAQTVLLENDRQKVEISVLKKEKNSDRVLEGAVFALTAGEDICNKEGTVIMKAGTVIEEKATDKDGKLTFTAKLPTGFSYCVHEIAPVPGFVLTDEVQEFTITDEDYKEKIISREFLFENEPTVVAFSKTSLTDGNEVEGAKLVITDEDGNTVEEWVSGKEPHIIRELTAGKTYVMTEVMPADGYVTAESIVFTVEDTGKVQKVEMKDDVTKVEISKIDMASGKELRGAKLTILDRDGKIVESWISEEKPHYIEMLPIGEYMLCEESAPEGYLIAENVRFEVRDTGEIQKVVMKDKVKTEEKEKQLSADHPDTGDRNHIMIWILLCVLAFAGVAGSVMALRRKRG